VVLLVLGGLQLVTQQPAAAADDAYLTTPMTGPLPVCPSDMFTISGNMDVYANSPVGGDTVALNYSRALGLKNNCANMNWQQPGNSSVIEQAMNAYATPNTFSINNQTQTVVFRADAVSAPGPLNVDFPPCMPRSTRAGGCTSPGLRLYVAYRLANGDGQFLGKWTIAGTTGNPNPYFDLTRGSCPDNYAGQWDPGYPDQGSPCPYSLNFVTDVNGKPNLTRAMQVAVAIDGVSGTETANGSTGYKYSSAGVATMVFTPGASTSLGLTSSRSAVDLGKPVDLTATAQGPAPGATVNFYATGAGRRTFVGSAVTDAQNRAVLRVRPSQTTTYTASLVSGGAETVTTSPVEVGVAPTAKLKAKRLQGAHVRFTGTVGPKTVGLKVQLQKRVGRKWKKVATATTKKGKVAFELTVPDGTTSYRIRTMATALYLEDVSKPVTVTGP